MYAGKLTVQLPTIKCFQCFPKKVCFRNVFPDRVSATVEFRTFPRFRCDQESPIPFPHKPSFPIDAAICDIGRVLVTP